MVVFTCNHCGETLQKPRVAKHYQFQCRTTPFLTCVDCFKDFRGEEYVAHTKCITEAERYGGKDYVPKASANKGEKKQKEWINLVNSLLDSRMDLTNAERGFLNTLTKYDNVPRKKPKFLNFVRSAIGNRVNTNVVESVWNKIEAAQKNNNVPKPTENQQQNGKVKEEHNQSPGVINQMKDENSVGVQNNENIETRNEEVLKDKDNETNGLHDAGDVVSSKKKKSKKRITEDTTEVQAEESIPKKKKKKATILSESSVNESENSVEVPSFDWKCTIISIVQNKGELSLKKLQKKVISRYMTHCGNTVSSEKATSKFNKKLKKVPEIVISEDKVKLTEVNH